MYRIVSGS